MVSEWHNGGLSLLLPNQPLFNYTGQWMGKIDGRKDRGKEERMEGRSWEQTLAPRGHTNTQTHNTQMSSVMQPAHGISILFMTGSIFVVPDPFVCVRVCVNLKCSWSLGMSQQTNTRNVGKQQSAGQSKGNLLTTGGATSLSSTMGYLDLRLHSCIDSHTFNTYLKHNFFLKECVCASNKEIFTSCFSEVNSSSRICTDIMCFVSLSFKQ